MLPVKYLEDLKTAPVDKVDFVATFQEVISKAPFFFGKFQFAVVDHLSFLWSCMNSTYLNAFKDV